MISLFTEFAIRDALELLRASQAHFKSRQVAEARRLLETVLILEGLPAHRPTGKEIEDAKKNDDQSGKHPDPHATAQNRPETTHQHHD